MVSLQTVESGGLFDITWSLSHVLVVILFPVDPSYHYIQNQAYGFSRWNHWLPAIKVTGCTRIDIMDHGYWSHCHDLPHVRSPDRPCPF